MRKYQRQAQSQPKHGPPSVSGTSKAPIAPPTRRPDERGSGITKKSVKRLPPSAAPAPAAKVQQQIIPESLQQLILDIFRETFPQVDDFEALKPALREIKDALDRRDFQRAFATEVHKQRYASRWSPSQALAYSNILAWIVKEYGDNEWVKRFEAGGVEHHPSNVLCFGRGAAELVALITTLNNSHVSASGQPTQQQPANGQDVDGALGNLTVSDQRPIQEKALLSVCLVDTTDWTEVVSKMHQSYTTPRPLSKYASTKARLSNTSPLSPQALSWKFTQLDILECGIEEIGSVIGPDPTLLTLFFTLNEMYLTSISKVSAFLRKITTVAPKGSLLLIVDKPGACVEARPTSNSYGTEGTQCPMHLLMHRALFPEEHQKTEKAKDRKEPAWEKLVEEDNCIFKLDKGLVFPGCLENIKFQMHLLQRL
ncbi:unnamed protein product [Clonostachys rhizophaga]|uniref:25S rRNA (Uridine(2843)-N(3))-methyltransferase n=1 Tax=Clonostachys rhizophaga TaxID=160324 RepID=A0A9N9YR49_9HYPO|nr:unnamed protein product [Clonostachys rhizophaga]